MQWKCEENGEGVPEYLQDKEESILIPRNDFGGVRHSEQQMQDQTLIGPYFLGITKLAGSTGELISIFSIVDVVNGFLPF